MFNYISSVAKGNAVELYCLAKSFSTFQIEILHRCNFKADTSQKYLKIIDVHYMRAV